MYDQANDNQPAEARKAERIAAGKVFFDSLPQSSQVVLRARTTPLSAAQHEPDPHQELQAFAGRINKKLGRLESHALTVEEMGRALIQEAAEKIDVQKKALQEVLISHGIECDDKTLSNLYLYLHDRENRQAVSGPQ